MSWGDWLVIDQEKLKVPNVGIRRNATKIRLENNSIPSDVNLSPDIKSLNRAAIINLRNFTYLH